MFTGACENRSDESGPIAQILGGATSVSGKAAGAGQAVGGHRGHGAGQGLDTVTGVGADGHHRGTSQPFALQDPLEVRDHGVTALRSEAIHLIEGDDHDLGVSRHGNKEVSMNDAVGVLLRVKDPHQDVDLAGHALGDGPVPRFVGVDVGQVDEHRGLTQRPGSIDARPSADVEPVQQRGGLGRGVRDDGEGLGGGGTGASGARDLGTGQRVGEAGLTRSGRAQESDHRGPRRQPPALRGLCEDVPCRGDPVLHAELPSQIDGMLQVFENGGEAGGIVVISCHRTLLPAGRRLREDVVRSTVAAS